MEANAEGSYGHWQYVLVFESSKIDGAIAAAATAQNSPRASKN